MKTVFLTLVLLMSVVLCSAQMQITITADQILIPADDYILLDNQMGGSGQICSYRIYANIPSGYQLSAIFGTSTADYEFSLSSGNTFYQSPYGSALAFQSSGENWEPLQPYDSWLTIGAENSTQADQYVFISAVETVPFFENFDLGYDVAIDTASLTIDEAIIFALNYFDENGYPLSTLNQADANGRVLIAQLTARQFVSGCMTFQLVEINSSSDGFLQTACFSFSPEYVSADFNQDGIVNIVDLTIIMSNFGCINGCNADLTGDNMVTAADLGSFIYYWSLYGEVN